MKKTYINPSTTVVRLSMIKPITASDPQVGIDRNATFRIEQLYRLIV